MKSVNRSLRVASIVALWVMLVLLVVWPAERPEMPSRLEAEQSPRVQLLRIGHDMPEDSVLHAAAQRLADALEERSGGRLQVALYPDQQLGNDHQMLEMTRRGELDLLLIPTAKLSVALPQMQLLDLPFYFPTADDVYRLLDGAPGQMLLDSLDEIGLLGITFWGGGFKQFTGNRPLLTPDDFAGDRFRVMKSRLLQAQFEQLGAEAIPIEFHQLKRAPWPMVWWMDRKIPWWRSGRWGLIRCRVI